MEKEQEVRNKVMREISDEMEPYKKPVPLSYRTFYVTIEHPRVPIHQGIRMLSIPCMGQQGLRQTIEWLEKFHPEWKIISPSSKTEQAAVDQEATEEIRMMRIQIVEEGVVQKGTMEVNLDSFNMPGMAGKKMSIRIPVKDRVYLVEVSRKEPNK